MKIEDRTTKKLEETKKFARQVLAMAKSNLRMFGHLIPVAFIGHSQGIEILALTDDLNKWTSDVRHHAFGLLRDMLARRNDVSMVAVVTDIWMYSAKALPADSSLEAEYLRAEQELPEQLPTETRVQYHRRLKSKEAIFINVESLDGDFALFQYYRIEEKHDQKKHVFGKTVIDNVPQVGPMAKLMPHRVDDQAS